MKDIYPLLSSYKLDYEFENFLEMIKNGDSEKFGKSEEGRPIYAIKIGEAPKCILSFAGIHGNEKVAITGVLRTLKMLLSGKIDNVTERVSYVAVPLLNPDGVERSQRKNAKGIDINRDFGKYGPFKMFGSEFESSEARAARGIIEYYEPDLVIDHHQNNSFDPEFFTMCNGEPEEMVNEVGFNMRKSVRELYSVGGYDVFDWGPPENKGMLVNYASRFCPSILIEANMSEMHTVADIAALKTLSEMF